MIVRTKLVVLALVVCTTSTLAACSSCGESTSVQPAEATSGSRPFHASWDGGRRHLRLRNIDGGALPADPDSGAPQVAPSTVP